MKKKKTTIILGSVIALCVVGLISSLFFDWPVDTNNASGDIGKADRFSREMEGEKLTNMEELLKTDSDFKDGIVMAQVIMQTRAVQFGTLVDMSNDVAGDIPAFAEVLKEMNATREMVDNVANSLTESAGKLDAALSGEECSDLEQTTINASLAYTTLQKQNKLANSFIETTDNYLEKAQGDDHLKFVRDQWVDYQKMTAALDGDKAAAEALAKKGNLLSGEKTLAAMGDFGVVNQVIIINSAFMTKNTGIDGSLANALPEGALEHMAGKIRNAAGVYGNQADAMNNQAGVTKFNQQVIDALNEAVLVVNQQATVGQQATVSNQQLVAQRYGLQNAQGAIKARDITIENTQGMVNQQAKVGQQATVNQQAKVNQQVIANRVLFQVTEMMTNANLMRNYSDVVSSAQKVGNVQKVSSQEGGLGNQIGYIIKNIAVGNRATVAGNRATAE